jgi:23S rRNA pseudouridine1911/1915/1917 synthase|tara:strand:+ start:1661 stop:2725 length:1065 start_codon:yes stop_codon:yes gene_type:complete
VKENEEEIQENSVVVNGEVAYEHYKHVVEDKQVTMRIDKFVSNQIANMTRTKTQKLADQGFVFVNDEPVKSSYKIKPKDVIRIVKDVPKRDNTLVAQDIPVNIVFEDDYFVIVNKAPGMVVHPSYGHFTGTLLNALKFHIGKLADCEDDTRPGLVHRIDKNTSGILVVAKTEHALIHLQKQFFDRITFRRYRALVWGDFDENEGTITGNIGRSIRNRKVMDVFPEGDEYGKHAVTHFTVLERFGYVTLVECRLETGRTHQIRAHFKYIGHPLFNDDTYGGDRVLRGTTFSKYKQFVQNCFKAMPRHALHAKSLGFHHPKDEVWTEFDSDLPADFTDVLERWRNYTTQRLMKEGE